MNSIPRVIIYRNELLPVSETFIQAQAAAMTNFIALFAGLRPLKSSLALASKPILLCRTDSTLAKVRGMIYKATGIAPSFHQRIRSVRPQLVHAHFAVDGVNALPLAVAVRRPLVVTLHGNDVTSTDDSYRRSISGRIYLARRSQLWKQASVFLCISEFIRRSAVDKGYPEAKLRTHYIGIDCSFFQQVSRDSTRESVLFVGRLVEKKGCTFLIRAMQEVQGRLPRTRLVVIGDGPERSSLEIQARTLGVRCEFRGAQPSTVVRQELSLARVFCVPSIRAKSGDSEGLGIVFAEAQAMGVPVVSSLHGGIPEVVSHGRTGLLASERDSPKLAQHIIRLFADEIFWRDCSRNAVHWISEKFDIRRQTQHLEEIYDQTCRTKPDDRSTH